MKNKNVKEKKERLEDDILRLEEIVEKLNGELDLESSLDLFEEGISLVKKAQTKIKNAKLRVNMIVKESGLYKEVPFKEIDGNLNYVNEEEQEE